MYRLLGNDVIDTEELINLIEKETNVKVREDISNATKREDAVGLRLSISISELGYDSSLKYEDEELMDSLLTKSDEFVDKKLQDTMKKFAENTEYALYAYSFDEVRNEVLLVFAMMSIYNAQRKLRDVIKRLLTI